MWVPSSFTSWWITSSMLSFGPSSVRGEIFAPERDKRWELVCKSAWQNLQHQLNSSNVKLLWHVCKLSNFLDLPLWGCLCRFVRYRYECWCNWRMSRQEIYFWKIKYILNLARTGSSIFLIQLCVFSAWLLIILAIKRERLEPVINLTVPRYRHNLISYQFTFTSLIRILLIVFWFLNLYTKTCLVIDLIFNFSSKLHENQ